ncbi:uncharacterized protein LOC117642738 isoform X2 [Thrips palmi]|uniref:Uncharacterized protein LOC117642738 isoform X2 n=1 Tax=Thrips palmi TaxID=161013 RepID=A0A6P8YKB2_THRPL|nr:uncharacterized protein LOC117642738 isoform X2 [Thrips palmi]
MTTLTRKGRKGKLGATRNSLTEDTPELVNGASVVKDVLERTDELSKDDIEDKVPTDHDERKKPNDDDASDKGNSATPSDFHGFDETPDPNGASVVNKLVVAGESQDGHKVLGQDIYTDSEDESPKQTKGTKQVKASSKKRPLEKLAEEFNDDEKPAASPPSKRARKKSVKAREAAGDSMDNMKLLSEVSSEVTSSEDIPRKTKGVKEEVHPEVTSSAGAKKSQENKDTSARRGRNTAARDATDPIYLKPFELGWKRELVYRGTGPRGSNDGKRSGDIYYYTPEGKKVRSRVEILEHLKGTDLKVDHFCFMKDPIGINDPTKEIIREASVRKSSVHEAAPLKREKSPKIPKQKALKGANAADSPAHSEDASNASAAGSNGPNTSPSSTPSTKAVTPRVVLKSSSKASPKPGPKVKLTPSRKSTGDSPPTKGKVGRPKKDANKTAETVAETGTLPPTWDPSDDAPAETPANSTSAPWKANSVPRPPAPPMAGPTPTEPPAPPQTVATIGGQKFIVVPKHNLLSVSPGAARSISPSTAPSGVYYVPGSGGGSEASMPKRAKIADIADATVESSTTASQSNIRSMENFISDLSNGYGALFHVMGYLKVQELLRASRVCRMWRDLSLHPNLWHTVRMKNSQVTDWDGFAAALSARGTRVLDLRKMLAPGHQDDIEHMWSEFCRVIEKADNLQRVELSRCPASVVEQLAKSCPQLRVINAIAIRSEEVDLESIRNVPLLEELRLKSHNGMSITGTLNPLIYCRLKHLSITSVKNLGSCNIEIISELENLESLELGDCIKLSDDFGPDHLSKLKKLQRLRLEKGQVPGCPVIPIIESIAQLPALRQLEIINFDMKPGFDKALAMCKQVRRLLIIPTYITTSATTNHIVLCSLPLLADTLEYLVWGLTLELTRVTDLFIDQCEARKGAQGSNKSNPFTGECIPIVKPVLNDEKETKPEQNGESSENKEPVEKMDVDDEKTDKEAVKEDEQAAKDKEDEEDEVEYLARGFRTLSSQNQPEQSTIPPVSILPIPKLHKLLVQLLPTTRIKILKVPFLSTWRQTFPELSGF